jgi:hypothetical protein
MEIANENIIIEAHDVDSQLAEKLKNIFANSEIMPVLRLIRDANLPDWWLAGGAVRNTVWRHLFPDQCTLSIKDFDVAFFDKTGDRESEKQSKAWLSNQLPFVEFDIKNQASFGVWRDWHFTFSSTEDGIRHWLHTATAVGIKVDDDDEISVLAPYGLSDLFAGIVRPTPYCAAARAAEEKGREFTSKCPALKTSIN